MSEIIENISFQEYCLTRNRVAILLNILGKEHKKDTTVDCKIKLNTLEK